MIYLTTPSVTPIIKRLTLRCQENNQSEMIRNVKRNTVANSRYHCCHLSTKMRSLYTVVNAPVGVNIKPLSVVKELWLFLSYKIFRTGVNNIKVNLMCSMSVHYIIQKTLNTNKCTKGFFVNYNTLLHVSTLLGHLQGETFCCRYTRLHYTVERECAVDCALRRGAVHSRVETCRSVL
jgi:hypothetical protein